MNVKLNSLVERVDIFETRLCVQLNSTSRSTHVRSFFKVVSRLGDGIFWYSLTAFLVFVHPQQGIFDGLHILLTALAGVIIYKNLKTKLVRERPFVRLLRAGRSARWCLTRESSIQILPVHPA